MNSIGDIAAGEMDMMTKTDPRQPTGRQSVPMGTFFTMMAKTSGRLGYTDTDDHQTRVLCVVARDWGNGTVMAWQFHPEGLMMVREVNMAALDVQLVFTPIVWGELYTSITSITRDHLALKDRISNLERVITDPPKATNTQTSHGTVEAIATSTDPNAKQLDPNAKRRS